MNLGKTIVGAVSFWYSKGAALWSRWGGTGLGTRLRFLFPGSRFDYEREAGDLWMSSVLAICIKWVGDNFPKPLMRVSRIDRRGNFVPMGRHGLIDLWQRPNKHYTGRTLSKAVQLSLLVDGNAYVIKVRSASGAVVELWWAPHWLVAPCWPMDGSEYISHYEYRVDGQPYYIRPRDVIHFRDGIDPRNERYGLATVKAQLREICTLNEASGYAASLLRNGAVPGLMLAPQSPDDDVDLEQARRLKGQLTDDQTGENRGGISILTGAFKVTKVGFSPEELRLDKLPQPAEARVCAAVGLSPMVMGLPDPGKTYSNLQEARSAAWQNCLVPIQDLVAETLRWQLLPDFDDAYKCVIEFDYTHVEAMQENQEVKSKRVREEYKAGLITKNEGREVLGYEPDPDGDCFYPGTGGGEDPADSMPEPDPDDQDQASADKSRYAA